MNGTTIIIVLNVRLYKLNYSTSISGGIVASTTILVLVVTGEILVNVVLNFVIDDVITSRNNLAIDFRLLLHNWLLNS